MAHFRPNLQGYAVATFKVYLWNKITEQTSNKQTNNAHQSVYVF